jgi:heterodisulfide reductase subunit B
VLFYPQVLGLALGLSGDEVGLRLNRVKSRTLMQLGR